MSKVKSIIICLIIIIHGLMIVPKSSQAESVKYVPNDYRIKAKSYAEKYWNRITDDGAYAVWLGAASKFKSFINGAGITISETRSYGSCTDDFTEEFREKAYNSLSKECIKILNENNVTKSNWIKNIRFKSKIMLPHYDPFSKSKEALFEYPDHIISDDANDCAHFISNCIGIKGGGIPLKSQYSFSYGFTSASGLADWIIKNNYAEVYTNFNSQKPEVGDVIIWKSPRGNHTTMVISDEGGLTFHTNSSYDELTYRTFLKHYQNFELMYFFHFVTRPETLRAPKPIYPIGLITEKRPSFQWTTIDNIEKYQIEINEKVYTVKSNFATSNIDEGTYQWRVRSISGNSTSIWSEMVSFSIQDEPTITIPENSPFQEKPPCGSKLSSQLVEFKWSQVDHAKKYELEIYGTIYVEGLTLFGVIYQSEFYQNSFSRHFDNNAEYSWRVRACNDYGCGPWSDHCKFTIDDGSEKALDAPRLISPCNEVVEAVMITFYWNLVANASSYELELYFENNLVTTTELNGEKVSGGFQYMHALDKSGSWKWRLKAKNAKSESKWSDYCNFTGKSLFDGEDPSLPDLVSYRVHFKSNYVNEGDQFFVHPDVKNIGQSSAGKSRVKIYFSPYEDFDTSDDVFFCECEVGALNPNQEIRVNISSFRFPKVKNTNEKTYKVWIIVVVDSYDQIKEANEDNVYKSMEPLNVTRK